MEEKTHWDDLLCALKMNQTQFAQDIGISKSYASKLVNGRAHASELLIRAVVQKYKVNRQWLERGESPMFLDVSIEKRRLLELIDELTDEQAKSVCAFIRCLNDEKS